ncbi:hypothetical protein JHW43_003740 [Diplocarpon mali]|nr:hypothetical protein JHW43_003740 [Diplocarpon mali]
MDVDNEAESRNGHNLTKQPSKLTVPSIQGYTLSQASPLANVPIEVLLNITPHLKTPDYCNLRLTCKQIENKVLDSFVREFFTKRQFMFSEFSLQALIGISNSRFSGSLSHVIFGVDDPGRSAPSPPSDEILGTELRDMLEEGNQALLGSLDAASFLSTGMDVDMIAEAFANLKNLETIGIRYGSTTVEEQNGRPFWSPHQTLGVESHAFLGRIFLKVLRGAGKALEIAARSPESVMGIEAIASSRPLRLQVALRNLKISDTMLSLPRYLQPSVRPVLAHLRTLYLDLGPGDHYMRVVTNNRSVQSPCYFLMKLLAETIELEHLRLNFKDGNTRGHGAGEEALEWLSTHPGPPTGMSNESLIDPPAPITWRYLRQIDIGFCKVQASTLLKIARKYRSTIRVISLHEVTLIHTDACPAEDRINLWATFFERLSALDLNLKGLNMSRLRLLLCNRVDRIRSVTFKYSKDPDTKNWAGTDTQSGLRDFREQVMVERLNEDTESEGDTGDEDSDGTSLLSLNSSPVCR